MNQIVTHKTNCVLLRIPNGGGYRFNGLNNRLNSSKIRFSGGDMPRWRNAGFVGDFLCVSIVLSSKKVPFGRYALRAIPPTSWAPPVHMEGTEKVLGYSVIIQ